MTSVVVRPADDLDETDRLIIRELRQRIEAALARLNDGQAVVDEATLREVVHEQVQAYQRWAREDNRPRLADAVAAEHELVRERVGAGPLQRYLDDPNVQEVGVVGPERTHLWMTDGSKHLVKEFLFRNNAEIGDLVRRLIAPSGRRLDVESPIVEAMLPDSLVRNGARLSAILDDLSPNGTVVTIRKFPRRFRHMEDLVQRDMLSWSLGNYLVGCVDARANIIISGPMHSGKSTLLDVLLCSMSSTGRARHPDRGSARIIGGSSPVGCDCAGSSRAKCQRPGCDYAAATVEGFVPAPSRSYRGRRDSGR